VFPVLLPSEPENFDADVRQRGTRWVQGHPDAPSSSLPDYWNHVRLDVQQAFDGRCAYLGYSIASGHVDHFVPKSRDRGLAYEWRNYRWAEPRVNQLKGMHDFLDPCAIESGWIEIDPATLLYALTRMLPEALRTCGERTISVLNDEELLRARRRMLRGLWSDDGWNLEAVSWQVPLLHAALME